jgi:hypothetical protein
MDNEVELAIVKLKVKNQELLIKSQQNQLSQAVEKFSLRS